MSPLSSFASGAPLGTVSNSTNVVFLTPYEHKGVVVMAVAGVSSCTFVSTLLIYIIFTALSPWPKRRPDSPTPFTRKQIAVFVICLLTSDLIQSISGIIQVKWAAERRITEGPVCSLQAATLVMGDLGSTVWSCVIAAHTFSGLALGKQWPRWAVISTVVTGWTFAIVLTAIGPTTLATDDKGPFYAIAGTWCFISSEYAIARLGIHYIPLFIAAATILVFYVLVFLVLRGTISFSQHQYRLQSSPGRMIDALSRERIIIAKRMLWYPVAFLTCILPIAIIRILGLRSEIVPEPVWIFAMFFLFFLGTVDSVIYATTRKVLNPIKPFKFQTHLRTFSDNSSTRTAVSSPKPMERFDDYGRDSLDKTGRVSPISSKGDFAGALHGQTQTGTYPEARIGAIHVTLERIQEVI